MIDAPADAAAALADWVELSDALLRGLIHALNNRITALGAFAELAVAGDEEFTPGKILPDEMQRMQQVNRMFRLLLADDQAPEALELAPVIDDAMALHAHHPRLRSLGCELRRGRNVLPVRAPRWALVRLVLLLIEGAKVAHEARGEDVALLHLDGTEDVVTLACRFVGELPAYAVAMAELCGGSLRAEHEEAKLTLPTLLALRRSERAAKSGAPG